jgi:hypothetical protein
VRVANKSPSFRRTVELLVLLLAACVLVPLADAAVRLPVTRHSVSPVRPALSQLQNASSSRGDDVPVEPNSVLFAHVVELKFGNSGAARLLIDTGSPDTMVLVGTVDQQRFLGAHPSGVGSSYSDYASVADSTFDLRLSQSAHFYSCEEVAQANHSWCANTALHWPCVDQPCTMYESYGDHSVRLGVVVRDSVLLPAEHQLDFMKAVRVSGGQLSTTLELAMDGILGLSPSDEHYHLRSTLDQLKDEGAIQERMFALCLSDAPLFSEFGDASDGDLILGAAHDWSPAQLATMANGTEFAVPLLINMTSPDDNGTFVPRYLVRVVGVQMDATHFPLNASAATVALVDSGTVRTMIPASLYSAITDYLKSLCTTGALHGAICVGNNAVKLFGEPEPFFSPTGWSQQYALSLVAADLSAIPPLQFQLDGGVVQLDWQHMFFPQDVGNGQTYYGFALQRSLGQMIILGNNLMRSYRTVFDVDRLTLTFATPNICAPPRGFYLFGMLIEPWMMIVFGVGTCLILSAIACAIAISCRRRRRGTKNAPKAAPKAAPTIAEEQAPLVQNDVEEQRNMEKLADSLQI